MKRRTKWKVRLRVVMHCDAFVTASSLEEAQEKLESGDWSDEGALDVADVDDFDQGGDQLVDTGIEVIE